MMHAGIQIKYCLDAYASRIVVSQGDIRLGERVVFYIETAIPQSMVKMFFTVGFYYGIKIF